MRNAAPPQWGGTSRKSMQKPPISNPPLAPHSPRGTDSRDCRVRPVLTSCASSRPRTGFLFLVLPPPLALTQTTPLRFPFGAGCSLRSRQPQRENARGSFACSPMVGGKTRMRQLVKKPPRPAPGRLPGHSQGGRAAGAAWGAPRPSGWARPRRRATWLCCCAPIHVCGAGGRRAVPSALSPAAAGFCIAFPARAGGEKNPGFRPGRAPKSFAERKTSGRAWGRKTRVLGGVSVLPASVPADRLCGSLPGWLAGWLAWGAKAPKEIFYARKNIFSSGNHCSAENRKKIFFAQQKYFS